MILYFKNIVLATFLSPFYLISSKYGVDFRFEELASMFEMNYGRTCFFKYCVNSFAFCQADSIILYCLHIYWLYRVLGVFYVQYQNKGKLTGDPRYKDQVNKID
jgi:hypothetical protein